MNEKVFLNVDDSDIFYRYHNFKFYFSSRATRERFIRKLEDFIKSETSKFINKYNVAIDFDNLFSFVLYNKTEKRGFKVEKFTGFTDENKILVIKEMPKFTIWGDYIDN